MDQIIPSPLYHTRTHEKRADKHCCSRDIRIYDSTVRTVSRRLLDFMASEKGENFYALLRLMMFQRSPKRAYISWHSLSTYKLAGVSLCPAKRRYKTADRNRRSYGLGFFFLAQNWCNITVSRAQCHRRKGTRRTDFMPHHRKGGIN
jgi:hypothetical protein